MQFFYVFFATMMYVLHKTYTIKIHKIPTEQYSCSKNVGIRLRMHKLNACKYELPKTNFFYGAQFGKNKQTIFYDIFMAPFTSGKHNKNNAIFKQIGMR